jgi:bacillithiol biosynthesis cysteine-adding enzyme BshC
VINFSSTGIPFSSTHQFPKLFLDYVSGAEQLRSFYAYTATNEGYAAAAANLKYDESIRPLLVEVIREQYAATEISVDENLISKLALPGTMTVCTGHQLCLFTGPLYFIYKIITTINLAEAQSKLLGKTIVPVYWMASEDHDFDEISSVNLFGKKIKWPLDAKGAVGAIQTDSLDSVLAELKTLLGDSLAATDLFAVIENAYRPGRTLAQATREFVNKLFAGKILILDANDKRLKKLFIPIIKNEIEKQDSATLVNGSIEKLAALGYEAQVSPRKINLFFMKKGIRERIEEKDGKFVVLNSNISFSKSELIYEIENYPGNFSPNVVLRPLYQQIILPNIAYVGGPGELSYWLEYKKMFDTFNITFPILQPRHFALTLDKNMVEKMAKLDIALEDLFGDIEELIKTVVKKNTGDSTSLEAEKETLKKLFESVREKIVPVDPTLKGAVDAELQKQINAFENLEAKALRAAKQKQETTVTQLRKLKEKILPEGILQERYENFIPFYMKYGEHFIPAVSAQFNFPADDLLLLTANL